VVSGLLLAFLFVHDTLPATAAESAERIQRLQESHAREFSAAARTSSRKAPIPAGDKSERISPHQKISAAELRQALERFVRDHAGALDIRTGTFITPVDPGVTSDGSSGSGH
jgi:hypothetical protein